MRNRALAAPIIRRMTKALRMTRVMTALTRAVPERLARRRGGAIAESDSLPPADPVRRSASAIRAPARYAPRGAEIEDSLRRSMDRPGDLNLRYQPICDAGSGDMVMAEALLRWTSPELGRVSPARFIPIAETSGMIVELGYRMIDQLCRDLAAWPRLRVSVNLSPAQLREAGFIDRMAAIIARHGTDPGRIEIEVTEALVVESPDLAAFRLDGLREAGHRIALDDFGTGCSSIGHLRKMNFDRLKIGRAFVDDIGVSPGAEDLLQSLSLLARALRLSAVAEGVEGADQVIRLREIGFDLLQGHHFGHAMPLDVLRQSFGDRIRKLPP